jgi:outer membrane biosynthesis protein TonB
VRKPLIFSGIFHAIIIAMMFVSFDLWGEPEIPEESVVVMLTEEDAKIELDAIPTPKPEKAPDPAPAPEVTPEAEKAPEKQPDPAEVTPPRVDEAAAAPEPEPAPVEEPIEKPEPPKKPEPVTKDLPNVTLKDKPKPENKFDPKKIALLLDKRDSTKPQATDPKKTKQTDPNPNPAQSEPTERNPREQAAAVANLQSAIASQVAKYWTAPVGATGAETLVIRLRIQLRADGELAREPAVLDRGRMMSDNLYRVAAEAAVRAVKRSAPLKLPPEYYDIWRDVELNFDPSSLM